MVHFTNGDIVRDKLLEARIGGDVVVCADVLHEGPCEAPPPRSPSRPSCSAPMPHAIIPISMW